jgi:hypothetical protein
MQVKEGAYLQTPALPFHFWLLLLPSRFCPPASALLFPTLSPSIFFFSSKKKEKKHKEKKTIEKKKMQRKEGAYL